MLANSSGFVSGGCLVPFGAEEFNDQSWKGEEDPLERKPPPANKNPPKNRAMLGFQVGFSDSLEINILRTASWTNHSLETSS